MRQSLRRLAAAERPQFAPVLMATNWYPAFDAPERDSRGRYWVGRSGDLGVTALMGA